MGYFSVIFGCFLLFDQGVYLFMAQVHRGIKMLATRHIPVMILFNRLFPYFDSMLKLAPFSMEPFELSVILPFSRVD